MMARKIGWFGIIVWVLAGMVAIANADGDNKQHKQKNRGTIVGQVSDAAGFPIEGVTVSIRKGASTITDAGGLYTLTGVKQKKRVVVSFEKEDYAPNQGIVALKLKKPKKPKGKGNKKEKWYKRANNGKLDQVTLNKVMIPAGEPQPIEVDTGGTVTQDGFKVSFPPGSLDASGTVEVVVSPIDVSTPAIQAFPGDFSALATTGERVLLETFSLMDIDITQNGQPVALNAGATAALEFLLPTNTNLTAGATVPLWFYDENRGIWREEGTGTVGTATDDPQRLAVFGEVTHFTWWNVDQPIETQTCLTGVVTDLSGSPVSGAEVLANGIDYNGTSRGETNVSGEYCVNVKRASNVEVTTAVTSGGAVQSASVAVAAPDIQRTCVDQATLGCEPVPALELSGLSCVEGQVLDNNGNAVTDGTTVSSTTGGSAVTTSGNYCMTAPAESPVIVFSSGFPPVTVTTGPAEDFAGQVSCTRPGSTGCTAAPAIQEPPSTSCLSGNVVDDFNGDPVVGADVQALTVPDGIPIGQPAVTDSFGDYCLTGLPGGIELVIRAQEFTNVYCEGSITANSGGTGGLCVAQTCNLVPTLTCFGGEYLVE